MKYEVILIVLGFLMIFTDKLDGTARTVLELFFAMLGFLFVSGLFYIFGLTALYLMVK